MRLVLLAFLDGGLVGIEIRVRGETLHALRHEVAVGHRVAHDRGAQALGLQVAGHEPRGLALAAAGPDGTDRDHGAAAAEHRPARSMENELRAPGHRAAGRMHHGLVADIAVAERDPVDPLVTDDPLELILGQDRDALRVEGSGELDRIPSIRDARDLRGRESHDLGRRVVAIQDVEVVEVASCGSHDHDPRSGHRAPPVMPARDAPSASGAPPAPLPSSRNRVTRTSPSICLSRMPPIPACSAVRLASVLQ